MPSFIFSEKVRILYATLMLVALGVKHCKWALKARGRRWGGGGGEGKILFASNPYLESKGGATNSLVLYI